VSKKPLLKNESLRQRVHADLTDIQSRRALFARSSKPRL